MPQLLHQRRLWIRLNRRCSSVEYDGEAPIGLGVADFDEWRVGVNTFWTPVSGLDIGVEVLYANIDVEDVALENDDRWEARFRVQRDF